MPAAAELMVRTGISLKQAVTELQVPLTTLECENILKRKSFQTLIWNARNRYSAEVAGDPLRTKVSTIGQMHILAHKLMEEGSYDKAAEVLFKLARMEGWVGTESTVNVFGNLSARDYEDLRKKVAERAKNEAEKVN